MSNTPMTHDPQGQPLCYDTERTIAEVESIAAQWWKQLSSEQVYRLRTNILNLIDRIRNEEAQQLADAQRRVSELEAEAATLKAKLDGMSVRRDDAEDRFLGSTTWKGWKVDLYSDEEGDDE